MLDFSVDKNPPKSPDKTQRLAAYGFAKGGLVFPPIHINLSLRINSRLKAQVATLLTQWQRRLEQRISPLRVDFSY